jgi:hypothetical protein
MNHKAVGKLQPKAAQSSLVPADNAVDGRNAIAPIDPRSAAIAQRRLQAAADQSPRVARLQAMQLQMNASATVTQAMPAPVVQLGRTPRKKRTYKKKKPANTRYGGCTFDKAPLRVKNAAFFDRPPSNSRSGQGDHIVSYTLICLAVATSVNGKALDVAGLALSGLVKAAKAQVKVAGPNSWWHKGADGLILRLESIDPGQEVKAKFAINNGINDVLFLLNTMPGTAMKNKKSTKGHGEGGSKGGISAGESAVVNNKAIKGNPWVNVFNLFDGDADKSLMSDANKLEAKVRWLMELFSRAAPTLYGLLKAEDHTLIPDTDLTQAVNDKFGTIKGLEISTVVEDWMG